MVIKHDLKCNWDIFTFLTLTFCAAGTLTYVEGVRCLITPLANYIHWALH